MSFEPRYAGNSTFVTAARVGNLVALALGIVVLAQGISNLGRGSYGPYVLICLGLVTVGGAILSLTGRAPRSSRRPKP